MKTIGLLGGMSWESSLEYYRIINQTVREKLGGSHSAPSVMVSLDFAEIETLQNAGKWGDAAALMVQAARQIERAGGDFLVICTNTMHLLAEEVQSKIHIPLLHIADATAQAVQTRGLQTLGLLGTRFTMEKEFYRGRLIDKHGLTVVIPEQPDREIIHRVIYQELVKGEIREDSRDSYLRVIDGMRERGAQGIILGCTEIGLLIKQRHLSLPVFDTAEIHARKAVEIALGDSPIPKVF
ncbi:MAG: aspartate/glutamate racemase family protein [Anaerolineales bacterium]|nr:aspartate/glutamate racemase family protein [Anaerolineales bacterium]